MLLQAVRAITDLVKGGRGRYGKDSGPWTTDMLVEAIYNGVKRSGS